MLKFNEQEIRDKLEKLSEEARIVFAASCCERVLPSYKKFVEIEHWGDYEFFRNILNEVWISICSKEIKKERLQQLIEKVFCLMPDEEDFESVFTSYALESSLVVSNTLKYYLTKEIKYLISIVKLLIATVDLFVQEKHDMDSNDPLLEEKINQDSLMQNELKRQLEDIHILEFHQIDEEFINAFRSRVEGKCNITF